MFWDKVSGLYDLFEDVYNGQVYRRTGKVVAGNVIHLLDDPHAAIKEMMRVCRKGGKVIIPTYSIYNSRTNISFFVTLSC